MSDRTGGAHRATATAPEVVAGDPPGAVPPERGAAEGASVGQLVGDIARDMGKLVRQEIELAKVEVKSEATKGGKAAGMLGGAGFAGWMAALFVSLAAMWLLDDVLPRSLAALVVCLVWAAVGALLFVRGRDRLRDVNPTPERTVRTLKEDAQWARNPTR